MKTFKSIFVLITILLLLAIFSGCASTASGSDLNALWDGDFQYVIDNNGTFPAAVITGYRGKDLDIVTPADIGGLPVTSIGNRAFFSKDLISVNIPEGVTLIGESAFLKNRLASVIIPESVTVIGNFAFANSRLTSITLPQNVTTIGQYAFENNNLASIIIPESVTSIGAGAFNSNSLTSVTIPQNITIIENEVFKGNNLTSIMLPEGLTAIGNRSFQGNSLTSVIIPDNVMTIGDYAFYRNNLTNIIISESVMSIGNDAFDELFFKTIDYYVESGFIAEGSGTYEKQTDQWFCNGIALPKLAQLICQDDPVKGTVTIVMLDGIRINKLKTIYLASGQHTFGVEWQSYTIVNQLSPTSRSEGTVILQNVDIAKGGVYDLTAETEFDKVRFQISARHQ